MTKATDIPKVAAFLKKINADNEQFRLEEKAEIELQSAIENYERVFSRKLIVNFKP